MALAQAAAPEAAERTAIVWEVRLGLALGLRPLSFGLLAALVLTSGALLFRWAVLASGTPIGDGPGVDLGFATRVALVAALSVGYTLTVWRWLVRSHFRGLEAAGGLPGHIPSARHEATLHEVPVSFVRRSRRAGALGVAIFLCTIEGPGLVLGQRPFAAWVALHTMSYMLFLGVLFFWIAGRAAYFSLAAPAGRAPTELVEVDLLDRRPILALGRVALRGSLTWVIGLSIGALAFVNPELRFAQSLYIFVPLLLITLAIASAALLLPVRGLHRRIVAEKRAELDRVEAAIRGDTRALAGSRIAERSGSLSLADLVAYRDLVRHTPEWPFEASSLWRFGLYTFIPVLSWIAGALVERGLGVLLD